MELGRGGGAPFLDPPHPCPAALPPKQKVGFQGARRNRFLQIDARKGFMLKLLAKVSLCDILVTTGTNLETN